MKAYKKILILSLCFIMMFSIIAVGSFGTYAADESDTVTIYFNCPVDEVYNSIVYGIYGFSASPMQYYEATPDESGVYVLEVPSSNFLESIKISFRSSLWQEMNIFAYSYNYDSISDVRLLEGLVLGGFDKSADLEPTFINGVWYSRESGQLIGDVDRSGELNVKDATYIQKCLVGSEAWSDEGELLPSGLVRYMADFNFDGERNVKDATLIQKYVAY